ncbi:MAG: hypothetical protein J6A14_02145 [Spirochaetaceae bacterium]|nr:hypothetical protein [Spirochaetaceae bacterium]
MIYRIKSNLKSFCHSSLFLLIFCLVSCTKLTSPEEIYTIDDTDTIRYETNNRIENTTWTEEIHKSKLVEKNIKSNSKVDIFYSEVKISQNIGEQTENPIYPKLEDFCSLDLSTIDSNTKLEITKLINKIKEENITKSDFLLGYQHEKILFDYEFSKHSKISGYFLGSPLEQSENHIFIPVQFLFEDGKLNSKIYLEKDDNTFKIKQIVFGEFISDQ